MFRQVDREALESSSPLFQSGATPSQLPIVPAAADVAKKSAAGRGHIPNRKIKRPGVPACDTWPCKASSRGGSFGVTSAADEREGHSPIVRPDARPFFVQRGSETISRSSFAQRVRCSRVQSVSRFVASYLYQDAGPRRVVHDKIGNQLARSVRPEFVVKAAITDSPFRRGPVTSPAAASSRSLCSSSRSVPVASSFPLLPSS
jgi:hypothetical protein